MRFAGSEDGCNLASAARRIEMCLKGAVVDVKRESKAVWRGTDIGCGAFDNVRSVVTTCGTTTACSGIDCTEAVMAKGRPCQHVHVFCRLFSNNLYEVRLYQHV